MRVAYLGCAETIGTDRTRADAFEHDQMIEALGAAFAAAGDRIEAISWDDAAVDWRDYDAAIIGTCWDYQDRLDEFLATLARIERQTLLANSLDLVRWNGRKTYLRDLEARGVAIVPTLWVDKAEPDWAAPAFDAFDTDRIVAKRQVGANAEGQFLLARGDPAPVFSGPMMLQPFLEAVASEGEYSFIFIDGTFSHAAIKRPADGDYRVQSSYGGREAAITPAEGDLAAVQAVTAMIPHDWLYARIDMVRGPDDRLLLIELELIEPFLYPLQGPELGPRLHAALRKRLA